MKKRAMEQHRLVCHSSEERWNGHRAITKEKFCAFVRSVSKKGKGLKVYCHPRLELETRLRVYA